MSYLRSVQHEHRRFLSDRDNAVESMVIYQDTYYLENNIKLSIKCVD